MKQDVSRRTFIQTATAAGIVLGTGALASQARAQEQVQKAPALLYRTLGRTGLKVTLLGFGAMRTSDPAVIRKAIDLGVNNIDTARRYMDGQNEEIVAKAVGDQRKELIITTKIPPTTPEQMTADVEASLKALNSDYIDILLLHSLKRESDLKNEDWLNFLQKVKKEGKVRFVGFSTHNNMDALLTANLQEKFYDVILTVYNFKSGETLRSAIAAAAQADIGIIAMKTQAGGYEDAAMGELSPHQSALKWVMNDAHVACTIPSMVTFDQLEENFKVMGSKIGWMDRKTLHRYGAVIDDRLCRMCGQCSGQCQAGVAISDIQRCLMYAEGYKDMQLAQTNYAELAPQQTLQACATCSHCTVTCPNGVQVAANLQRAKQLFA